jgi:hypothetical protein
MRQFTFKILLYSAESDHASSQSLLGLLGLRLCSLTRWLSTPRGTNNNNRVLEGLLIALEDSFKVLLDGLQAVLVWFLLVLVDLEMANDHRVIQALELALDDGVYKHLVNHVGVQPRGTLWVFGIISATSSKVLDTVLLRYGRHHEACIVQVWLRMVVIESFLNVAGSSCPTFRPTNGLRLRSLMAIKFRRRKLLLLMLTEEEVFGFGGGSEALDLAVAEAGWLPEGRNIAVTWRLRPQSWRRRLIFASRLLLKNNVLTLDESIKSHI